MEQLSIIIVNWNTGSLLLKCLESIASLPEQSLIHHVVVIDNASSDASIIQAKDFAQEQGYAIIQEKNNLGFAKANNVAWQYIKKHGGADDHILLLNPDTEVHADALRAMLDVFTRHLNVGIVGPKLLEKSGEVQMSVRSFPTLGIFTLFFLKLHRMFSESTSWKKYMLVGFNYSREQDVDQVMGAAFLIRNTVLQKIGLLDESYWIWFEEVDYCKRAKDAGWNILYTPSAVITHYGGTSFQQVSGRAKAKLFAKSSLLYAKKHLGIFAYSILLFLYPLALLIALIASLAHIQQKKNISRL